MDAYAVLIVIVSVGVAASFKAGEMFALYQIRRLAKKQPAVFAEMIKVLLGSTKPERS